MNSAKNFWKSQVELGSLLKLVPLHDGMELKLEHLAKRLLLGYFENELTLALKISEAIHLAVFFQFHGLFFQLETLSKQITTQELRIETPMELQNREKLQSWDEFTFKVVK